MTRFVKKHIWWSSLLEPHRPQYLYWDESTEHFETGCYGTARKHKWEFTDEEVAQIENDYPVLDDFMTEKGGENE